MLNRQNESKIDFFSLPLYNFGNFQTKGSFIDISPQLKEALDVLLKNSELQKISRACSTTFLPQDFATMIWSVPTLKNALKLLYLRELQEQSKSLCKKKEDQSVLRVGSKCYQQLISFSWAKSLTEWQERAPDVLDTLSAIAVPDNYLSSPQRADAIIPPLCTACSILLNTRILCRKWYPLFLDLEDVAKWYDLKLLTYISLLLSLYLNSLLYSHSSISSF